MSIAAITGYLTKKKVSRASTDTSMYLEKDSNKEAFLEGGGADAEAPGLQRAVSATASEIEDKSLKGKEREDFIKKVYGMLTIQVFFQMVIVGLLAKTNTTLNCRVQVPLGLVKIEPKCAEKDWLYPFFTSPYYLWAALILTAASIWIAVRNKEAGKRLPDRLGYPCWLAETIGLCYLSGFVAA